MNPIPLTSPNGTVMAYACGICLHVRTGGESFGQRNTEDLKRGAEWSREAAERCCRCQACKGINPLGSADVLHCAACKPAEDAKWEREAKERARQIAENAALKRARSRVCALQLRDLMREISEDYYCAGWINGLEFSCWSFAHGGNRGFGLGEVTQAECDRLRELGEQAGGWWTWRGEVFVTTEEWAEIWSRHLEERH